MMISVYESGGSVGSRFIKTYAPALLAYTYWDRTTARLILDIHALASK